MLDAFLRCHKIAILSLLENLSFRFHSYTSRPLVRLYTTNVLFLSSSLLCCWSFLIHEATWDGIFFVFLYRNVSEKRSRECVYGKIFLSKPAVDPSPTNFRDELNAFFKIFLSFFFLIFFSSFFVDEVFTFFHKTCPRSLCWFYKLPTSESMG